MLLGAVFNKLVYLGTTKWSWQCHHKDWKDPQYFPPYCAICKRLVRCEHTPALSIDHIKRHFSQQTWKPYASSERVYSGVSCSGLFAGNKVKWLIVDMDSPLACAMIKTQLIPVLDKYQIDWCWEHSGRTDFEKAHLLIFFDCLLAAQRNLVKLLLAEAGLDNWQELKLKYPDFAIEFFPYQHEKEMIRFPGSVHLRTGQVNNITFKGQTGNDEEFILKALNKMKVLDSNRVAELILKLEPAFNEIMAKKQAQTAVLETALSNSRPGKQFSYMPISLSLPMIPVAYPRRMRKILSNCQAMNTLWNKTVSERFLEGSGDNVHKWGLLLDSLALFDKLTQTQDDRRESYNVPITFIDWTYENFRPQGYEGHNWDTYKDKFHDKPYTLIPSCEKMENRFGLCNGCQFKKDPSFHNPGQFVSGTPIYKSLKRKLNAVSNEYIRTQEFPKIKSELLQYLMKGIRFGGITKPRDIVLAHHQGAGKSQMTDEFTASIGQAGLSTLLAVRDSNLALQHKQGIEASGQRCYMLFSHEKLFSDEVKQELNIGFDCPFYNEIQTMLSVNPDSGPVKNAYCRGCALNNKCPYPRQYAEVANTTANVVIMQHAHFGAQNAMNQILSRPFHLLTVDENFITNCVQTVKAEEDDLIIIQFLSQTYPWLKDILRWLTAGGFPQSRVTPHLQDLMDISKIFAGLKRKYIIPDILRAHNEQAYYDLLAGAEKFIPVPRAGSLLRLFTDATAPIEYMKVILNNPALEVLGNEFVLNPKIYHPLNEYRQALDGSTAVRQMNQPGYLEFLLSHACREMEKALPGETGLITVYRDQVEQAQRYITHHYPHLGNALDVSWMKIGTNEYAHKNYQWLMAGRYPNALDLAKEAWKLALIWNAWIAKEGACLGNPERVDMPYHNYTSAGASYAAEWVPLTRTEWIHDNAWEVEYPNLTRRLPAEPVKALSQKLFLAVKNQANRMRYKPNHKIIVRDYDREPTNHVVTESFLIADCSEQSFPTGFSST